MQQIEQSNSSSDQSDSRVDDDPSGLVIKIWSIVPYLMTSRSHLLLLADVRIDVHNDKLDPKLRLG